MKIFRIILCALIFQLCPVSVYADESGRLLTFSGAEDSSNNIARVIYYALKQMGYEMTIALQGMSSAAITANSGQTDGLVCLTKGFEETYPNLIPIEAPIGTISFLTYAKNGNSFPIDSWSDLSSYKVGFLVQKFYIENHMPENSNISRYDTFELLWQALLSGEIDVAVVTNIGDQPYLVDDNIHLNSVLETLDDYMFLNKKNQDLVPQLTKILREFNADGTTDKILNNELDINLNINGSKNKVVLHISSFGADMPWEVAIRKTLQERFIDTPYEFHSVNLDSLQMSNSYKNKMILNAIQRDFLSKPPDIIIVSDNEAAAFVKDFYNTAFNATPVVFFGVNNYGPHLVSGFETVSTGVAERISADEIVTQMLKMFPKTKGLYVINDYSRSGWAIQSDIEKQLKPFEDKIAITYNENLTYQQLMDEVHALPADTLILSGFYFIDSVKSFHFMSDFQADLTKYANAPFFGILSTHKGFGQLGGKYTDPALQANYACDIVDKILSGTAPSEIPVVINPSDENKWIFDNTVMKKWGIKKSDLPKNAEILNKDYNIIEDDPATFAVLFMAGLSVVVLVIFTLRQRKNNRALVDLQKTLHSKEEILKKESEITETKKQQLTYLSIAPVLFIVTLDDTVVYINHFAQETTGLDLGDHINRLYEDCEEAKEVMHHIMSSEQADGSALKLRILGGEFRSFFTNFMPTTFEGKEAIVICAMDIEESEQQDRLLESMQQNLQRVMDALPLPSVIKIAETSKTVYANDAFLRMFSIGTPLSGSDEISNEISNQETGTVYEKSLLLKSGEKMDASIYARRVFFNGNSCEIMVIQDITADKKQKKLLQSMAEKEKEANKIKSRFVVNMSHEVRTPMNAIIGLTEIALTKGFQDEIHSSLKKVNTSAKHLLHIINDVLDFSKLEADKLELFENDFNLVQTLEDIALAVSEKLDNRPIELKTAFDSNLPQFVWGDQDRFWQVVGGLVENASKFTKKGHILFAATCPPYEITDDSLTITFTVSDTGIGMTPEQVGRLFIPFEQFHKGLSSTGTGLGLSVAKQLVTLMGGDIQLESECDVGTKATVVIPFSISKGDLAEQTGNAFRCLSAKVLVVEDNAINQEVIGGMLAMYAITPTFAGNGKMAVDILSKQKFDLVFMDIHMPEMGGVEATQLVRHSDSLNQQVPIVALTADTDNESLATFLESGMNGHLAKPIELHTLASSLKKWLV